MAAAGKSVKKESKKYIPVKTSFTSPFPLQWGPLPDKDRHFILETLMNKLVSMGLEKKEVKVFRPWRKKKQQEPAPQVSPDQQLQDSPRNGWTDVAARRQLAIGINEVTKALERNALKLVLVCKSVRPKHMMDHLIALSASRGVPACQVPRLSHSLSEPLGLKSVLALGFRRWASKDDEVFMDTVDAITPRVPSLNVAWLQNVEPRVTPGDPADMKEEEDEEKTKRVQERKRKSECEEVTESTSSCTLQPLKVKKIVANPAKKRKLKMKS